jgi:hypothetical protein
LPAQARMMTTMTLSSSWSLAKPWNNNNDNDYNEDSDDKDVVIASTSKKNDNHNILFFAMVMVAVVVADKGVIHPRRCPLTSTPSGRRRGGDPLSSKPQSANDNKDNDPSLPAQARMTRTTCGHHWGCGQWWSFRRNLRQRGEEAKRQRRRQSWRRQEATQQPAGANKVGGKDGRVKRHMMKGQDDGRGRHANKVEGSRMGNNCGNIRQQK